MTLTESVVAELSVTGLGVAVNEVMLREPAVTVGDTSTLARCPIEPLTCTLTKVGVARNQTVPAGTKKRATTTIGRTALSLNPRRPPVMTPLEGFLIDKCCRPAEVQGNVCMRNIKDLRAGSRDEKGAGRGRTWCASRRTGPDRMGEGRRRRGLSEERIGVGVRGGRRQFSWAEERRSLCGKRGRRPGPSPSTGR